MHGMSLEQSAFRLDKVASILEDVEEAKFHMSTWKCVWESSDCKCGEEDCTECSEDRNDCGTTACAAGWAASNGWFRARGFMLSEFARREYGGEYDVEFYDENGYKYTSFDACERAFGISSELAAHLFSPSEYRTYDNRGRRGTKEQVIARFRTVAIALRDAAKSVDDE